MKRLYKKFLLTACMGVVALCSAPSLLAHARPKVMVPAADSSGPAPEKISVTFSEAIEPKFSSLTVTDEHGKKLNTANSAPLPSDPTKTLTLPVPSLTPGSYLVKWVSVAADGHRMEGEYEFTVK